MSAKSWTLETVFEREINEGLYPPVAIIVKAEVPIGADNTRLPRYGNRHWPTMVDIEPLPIVLHPDGARAIADALREAADACDAIDQPDTDTCGHWAPCDSCKRVEAQS